MIFKSSILTGFLVGISLCSDYYPINIGNTWVLDMLDENGSIIGYDSMNIASSFFYSNHNAYWYRMNEYISTQGPSAFYLRNRANDIYVARDSISLQSAEKYWQ